MDKLGNSIARYKNSGAQLAFWLTTLIIAIFVFFAFSGLDSFGITMLIFILLIFSCLDVYMYFKAKTEMDIREHGIFVRTINKKHEILYNDIAELNKTMRVGKSGYTVITYYLLVIIKKDGERIVMPFRVSTEFIEKFQLAMTNNSNAFTDIN